MNPILAIQFIFKGEVLPDQLTFAKKGIHPKKDVITVMVTKNKIKFTKLRDNVNLLTKVNIYQLWNRQFKKSVYSCIIANLMGNQDPEIIGCSFGAEMKAFDLKGNEVFLTEFASNITCFKIASVSQKNAIELISGSIDGHIYVMDIKGNPIWSKKLDSPVICMETGDLKDDGKDEIVVGLDNQQLVCLDNKGDRLLEFKTEEPIIDCTIGYFSDDYIGKIFVLLKSGKILNVNNEGNSELVIQLENQPTRIAFCDFNDQPIMIVGDKSGVLKIFNSNKEIIGEYEIGTKIGCLDKHTISSGLEKNVFLVTASKNEITFFKLIESKKKEIIEIPVKVISEKPQTQVIPTIPVKSELKAGVVRVLRGAQLEGGEYVFKVKVVNDGKYNITDVNIHIVSYPEESLILSRVDGHPNASPDRAKFYKISKGGGFVSPSFIFSPLKDCIKGTIHAVINFINEEDQIETIHAEPHEIRMICGLLKPRIVSDEEFENLSQDLLSFKRVGEKFTVPYKAEQLYQKLYVLLERKNFAIINTAKQESSGNFIGIIKGFAEGSFNKHSVGLNLTITGRKDEQRSNLKVDIFAEDEDMSPSIMSEFKNAVSPQSCPECEQGLPSELVKRILAGLSVYCENCGLNLLEINKENK